MIFSRLGDEKISMSPTLFKKKYFFHFWPLLRSPCKSFSHLSPKVTKSCSKKKAKIAPKSMFMDNFQNLIKTFFHHYIGSKLFLSFFKMSVMHEENLGQYN